MAKQSIFDDRSDTTFVGARVSKTPVPYVESFKVVCENCGEDIWADERLERQAITANKRICVDCLLADNKMR